MTKQKYIVCTIKAWMNVHDKKAPDMAHLMGISIDKWYRRIRDPSTFTVKELELLERVTKAEFLKGAV